MEGEADVDGVGAVESEPRRDRIRFKALGWRLSTWVRASVSARRRHVSQGTDILCDQARRQAKRLKCCYVDMRRVGLSVPDWRVLQRIRKVSSGTENGVFTPRNDLAQSTTSGISNLIS